MSANVTEVLAGFAASLQYDDVPERVRDHCKNLLLDTLACAVAGHRGEETQQIAALASGLAQSNESSIIGGEALSLAGAPVRLIPWGRPTGTVVVGASTGLQFTAAVVAKQQPDGAKQHPKSEAKSATHGEPALELGHDAHCS